MRAGTALADGRGIAFLKIIVTGGAGFIGSAVCRHLVRETDAQVVNIDKLTYAANLRSLDPIADNPRYHFIRADICDRAAMEAAFARHQPDAVMHLAAESHVDRSINGSDAFIQTNVVGTHTLLEAARAYWADLPKPRAQAFRFLHVSTDEVYGSLGPDGDFSETTRLRSILALLGLQGGRGSSRQRLASHLRPAGRDLQLLEQLRAVSLPGKADPARHPQRARWQAAAGLRRRLQRARLAVRRRSCARPAHHPDARADRREVQRRRRQSSAPTLPSSKASATCWTTSCPDGQSRRRLITFVRDRPGHDHRYAIDATKLETELGWRAQETFETGLAKTVRWYLDNRAWWEPLRKGVYAGERLGLVETKARAG